MSLITSPPPATTTNGFVPRLALFYGAICLAIGTLLPYLSVWFAAKGLDATEIGVILAAPVVARVLAVPFVTNLADRFSALQPALVATSAAAAASYTLVGLVDGFWPILLTVTLAAAAFAPLMPLADAYALGELPKRGRAYGPVRLWGSAAFIAGTVGAGFLLDHLAPRHLIWVVVAAFIATAVASLLLPAVAGPEPGRKKPRPSALVLLRSPSLIAVIAAASLVQSSHALYYGFSALAWTAAGIEGTLVGALWGIGVVAEIVLFAFSARLPPSFGPTMLLAIGAAGATVRWGAMALDPPQSLLPFLQCLHALSFGATHLGAVLFIARAAPPALAATAQGYLSMAIAVISSAAVALAGISFGAVGERAYAIMALLALAGIAFATCAHLLRREHGGI